MEKFKKLLIDTDIGDDIDDAFALFLLSPYLENKLVGITTVFKNAFERAKIASYLCNELSINTVICAGESKPLFEEIHFLKFEKQTSIPHISQYCSKMKKCNISDKYGPDYIIDCAEKYGQDLTILAIGPMTNLALAYKKSPSSFRKIGNILMMAGNTSCSCPEWNIKCDPEAFDIVLRSGVDIRMVGFDITKKSEISTEDIDILRKLSCKPICELLKLLDLYLDEYKHQRLACLHDPLTASVLLNDFISFENKKIEVCLHGEKRGTTSISNDGLSVLVATKADYKTFNKFLFQTFTEINEKFSNKEVL